MAEIASSLTTAIARRIRDPNNGAHTATDIRTLLTHAQRIINSHTNALLAEESATQTAGTVILSTANLTSVDRVNTVRYEGRDLDLVPWESLKLHDPTWLTTLGATPRVWAPIGRMLFAVWPGALADRTLTIVGPKITAALSSAGTATEIRDQHMPAILNLVEQLLLMRHRLFTSAKKAAERRPFVSKGGNP